MSRTVDYRHHDYYLIHLFADLIFYLLLIRNKKQPKRLYLLQFCVDQMHVTPANYFSNCILCHLRLHWILL